MDGKIESGYMNNELVFYSNGPKLSYHYMVCYSGLACNQLEVLYSVHRLHDWWIPNLIETWPELMAIIEHLSGKQVKVCYSDVSLILMFYSDPHCSSLVLPLSLTFYE